MKKMVKGSLVLSIFCGLLITSPVKAAPMASSSTRIGQNSLMTTDQSKIVNEAKKHLGKPYVWGGKGPNSFDCSGLVQYVYKQGLNMTISAPTVSQEKYGKEVKLTELQPGDVLFYGSKGSSYHNGIYIGNNQMIHAPVPGQTVSIVDIKYFYPQFAKRMIQQESKPIDLSSYYTTNPGKLVTIKDDYYYTSKEMAPSNKSGVLKKETLLTVSGIEYSSKGIPALKLSNGLYMSADKKIAIQTPSNIASYYTVNPSKVVVKKDDYYYKHADFGVAARVKPLKKDTLLNVSGIEYSNKGIPRLKLTNGQYISAHQSSVVKAPNNIGSYYTSNPGKVVVKKDDYYYKYVNFGSSARIKSLKKNTLLTVSAIEYSDTGIPRLKLTNGQYISAHQSSVVKAPGNINNYYTLNPKRIEMKKTDSFFHTTNFVTSQKAGTYKKGQRLSVKQIEYSATGIPRLKLINGKYVSAHKSIVNKY